MNKHITRVQLLTWSFSLTRRVADLFLTISQREPTEQITHGRVTFRRWPS